MGVAERGRDEKRGEGVLPTMYLRVAICTPARLHEPEIGLSGCLRVSERGREMGGNYREKARGGEREGTMWKGSGRVSPNETFPRAGEMTLLS